MKILVADDDPTIRSELSELLREDGHEVDTAADGREAIQRIETQAYDAALLDLVMPRSTGLDVLRRAAVVSPRTAVIMITGQGTIDTAVEAMKAGAVDFIEKPPEIEAIQRSLRALSEERRAWELLAPAAAPEAVKGVLEDAARRKALLAFVGPGAAPPKGAGRVLRLDEDPRPPDTFAPNQLYQINAAVEAHLAGVANPVVFAAGLTPLETLHGPDDVRSWIRQIAQRCEAREGTLVLGPREASLAPDAGPAGLSVDESLQGMLESLANPTRRAIVSYVFASGPSAYSAILRQNFVDSSSKLSFHLQKLQADRLLTKGSGGAYVLTEDGRRAWRVVRALRDERRRPAVLLAPP